MGCCFSSPSPPTTPVQAPKNGSNAPQLQLASPTTATRTATSRFLLKLKQKKSLTTFVRDVQSLPALNGYLEDGDVDIDEATSLGQTSLMILIERGELFMAKYLVKQKGSGSPPCRGLPCRGLP